MTSENAFFKYINLKNAVSVSLTILVTLMIRAIENSQMEKALMYVMPFFLVLMVAYLILILIEQTPAIARWWAEQKKGKPNGV